MSTKDGKQSSNRKKNFLMAFFLNPQCKRNFLNQLFIKLKVWALNETDFFMRIFLLGIKRLSIQIPYFNQTPKFEQF